MLMIWGCTMEDHIWRLNWILIIEFELQGVGFTSIYGALWASKSNIPFAYIVILYRH